MKFERYGIIYGEDAPMPPSLKNLEIREKGKLHNFWYGMQFKHSNEKDFMQRRQSIVYIF